MKQILHIFWKDARRLWIEILLSLVMAALFAWVTPKSWLTEYGSNFRSYANLLVPVGWWLIIARLIHGEGLVGDRQFWVTRPYEWPKLLAAKALFVTLFVYLPFLLMGASILLQAGFNPLSYIPGLLYWLLLISVVFFPLIGLAAVTSNLARMVLTILSLYVAFVVWSTFVVRSDGNNAPLTFSRVPSGGLASVAVVLLVCGARFVLQYARRRVFISRLLLGAAPFLVLLASFICNRSLWMAWAYPPVAQTEPPIIRMIPFEKDEKRHSGVISWGWSEQSYNKFDTHKWNMVKVEIRASGVAVGDRWQLDAFRPTLTPPNGAPLKLDWQQGREVFETPDDPNHLDYYFLKFLIRRAVPHARDTRACSRIYSAAHRFRGVNH